MAKKKTAAGKMPRGENIRAAILAAVSDLLGVHLGEGVMPMIDESELKKGTVTFKADIDCSESRPKVIVGIRFSQTVTDNRTTELEDPDQGTFTFVKAPVEAEQEAGETAPAAPETTPEGGEAEGGKKRAGKGGKGGKGRGGRKKKDEPTAEDELGGSGSGTEN